MAEQLEEKVTALEERRFISPDEDCDIRQKTRELTVKSVKAGSSQGTSNGGQRSSNLNARINRRSDLPYNGVIWRFDRLLLKNWRPPFEVLWNTAKVVFESKLKPVSLKAPGCSA